MTASVSADISGNYLVSTKFKNNFADAADKINSMIDATVESTSFLGAAADQINEFNSFIGELSADVNSLVTDPNALALSVTNLFSNIDGLFGTVENTAKAFKGLFGFGDNDEDDILPTTAGRMHDLVDKLRVVQPLENTGDHRLLFAIEKLTDPHRSDVPIIVDLRPQRMVELKSDFLLLLRRERLVKMTDERLG